MTYNSLFERFVSIKERIKNVYEDKRVSEADFKQLKKEIDVLFPYLNYSRLPVIKINEKMLEYRLNEIEKILINLLYH